MSTGQENTTTAPAPAADEKSFLSGITDNLKNRDWGSLFTKGNLTWAAAAIGAAKNARDGDGFMGMIKGAAAFAIGFRLLSWVGGKFIPGMKEQDGTPATDAPTTAPRETTPAVQDQSIDATETSPPIAENEQVEEKDNSLASVVPPAIVEEAKGALGTPESDVGDGNTLPGATGPKPQTTTEISA